MIKINSLKDIYKINKLPNTAGIYYIYYGGVVNKIKVLNKPLNPELLYYKFDKALFKARIEKYKRNDKLIYIGQTKNLRKRIFEFVYTIFGDRKNHLGGMNLSYVSNFSCFYIRIEKVDSKQNAIKIENRKLTNHQKKYGYLPLGNRIK